MGAYDNVKGVLNPATRGTVATGAIERRMVLSIEGLDKCGKTHLALTAPGPMGYLNFDRGLKGVIEKFQSQKRITVFNYEPVSQLVGQGDDAYDRAYAQFQADYRYCLKTFRTTVVDTLSEGWGSLRLAEFGKLAQVMPHHYTKPNMIIKGLIDEIYEYPDKNLILVHSMKDEYINDKKTGKYEIDGFKKIYHVVQMAVRLRKIYIPADERTEDEPESVKLFMDIKACRQNLEIEGTTIEGPGPMFDFSNLAQLVFPNSTAADWR